MPRATTKAELIQAANGQFDKLWKLIDSMSEEEQNADFCFDGDKSDGAVHWKRDKNLRDVLTHLYEWHKLVLDWVTAGENGEKKPFLPQGITWANYQKMNTAFWEKHQNTPYQDAKKMLKDSHFKIMAFVERYSEDELFKMFPFGLTAKSSIAEYCRAATASHYDWAVKKLKVVRK